MAPPRPKNHGIAAEGCQNRKTEISHIFSTKGCPREPRVTRWAPLGLHLDSTLAPFCPGNLLNVAQNTPREALESPRETETSKISTNHTSKSGNTQKPHTFDVPPYRNYGLETTWNHTKNLWFCNENPLKLQRERRGAGGWGGVVTPPPPPSDSLPL